MVYATFDDYVTRFLGRAIRDEADFNRLALRASAFLDRMTMGKARRYRDTGGKLSLACCAVTEKMYAIEEEERERGGRLAEEQVGDYRVRVRARSREDDNAEMEALAEMYLFGTGLMDCGIPVMTV